METVSAIQLLVESGFSPHAHTAMGSAGYMVLHDSRSLYFCKLLVDHYVLYSSARLSLAGSRIF